MEPWSFSDQPKVAVIADRRIVGGEAWIAFVSHDAEDGCWQFHTSDPGPPREEDARVVSLRSMVECDRSLVGLADLPPGWRAWRGTPLSPWERTRAK